MNKSILTLTASAFLLATTMATAQAQTSGSDDTMQQGQQGEYSKKDRDGKKYRKYHRDRRSMRHHGRMGHGMGYGMDMGHGMGHGAMMQVVFAMMDANGDGSLSLQEVQDAHARIFAHMDADDNDQVTKEEIRAFFRGKSGRDADMSDDMDDTDNMDDTGQSDDATQPGDTDDAD